MGENTIGQEIVLRISGELRVQTRNSMWFIRPDRYLRMPLVEGHRRPASNTLDGALDDLRWIKCRKAVLVRDRLGDRIRLVPDDRGPEAQGVITGDIVASSPRLDDLID
jgi:hypothetical protein